MFKDENVFVIIKNGSSDGSTDVAQTLKPKLTEEIYFLGFVNSKIVIKTKNNKIKNLNKKFLYFVCIVIVFMVIIY